MKAWYTPVEARPGLRDVVACGWTAEPSGEHLLVPDGCIDLLWIQHPVASTTQPTTQSPDRSIWLCGPETTAWRFALPPGTNAAGVRFRPGYGSLVVDVDAAAIVNRRVRLRDLDGLDASEVAFLADDLAATDSVDSARRRLEDFVARRIERDPGRRRDPLVESVLEHVAASRIASQRALAQAVGFTPRQLHRRVLQRFGYGTAQLARLLRFQRFLAQSELGWTGRTSLASLAGTAGYADQAHLARDCRAITGMPPRRFLDIYFPTFPDMSDPFKTKSAFSSSMTE